MTRLLPPIMKQAHALAPSDPPTGLMGDVLRRWLHSEGVSDLVDGPLI